MVERWGLHEVTLNGPNTGNPFVEVALSAEFVQNGRTFQPQGFYDGNGIYKIRFMPDEVGEWTYITNSNCPELNGITGQFTCIEPTEGNNGPVKVYKDFTYNTLTVRRIISLERPATLGHIRERLWRNKP